MKSFGLTASEFAAREICANASKDLKSGFNSDPIARRIQGFPYSKGIKRRNNYAHDNNFLTNSTRQLRADVCEPIQWLR
jgi:hypothetical protein